MPARLLTASAPDLHQAVTLLRDGGVVAVPTETVYGLAADAARPAAVRRIFAVKGRPATHPLILHVADLAAAKRCAAQWTACAEVLARSFWPGPLAVLVQKSAVVDPIVTGGRDTVALRVPRHEATLALLRQLHAAGSPGLAAPSANRFGAVSPTTAQHVLSDLGDAIDAVVDGGGCDVGVESTIVDCRSETAVILRPGGVPIEAIGDALAPHGITAVLSSDLAGTRDPNRAIASGMLASHYAPRARVDVFEHAAALEEARRGYAESGTRYAVLPAPDDVFAYSRGLFASLRACDASGVAVILALLPPPTGLGLAVRDRLLKASAAR